MADITLGDYAGYIFSELIKAREMADEYSRQVAERYRQTPILEHFSVPRFKIPKMEINVPVLISGASYSQSVRFKLSEGEFLKLNAKLISEFLRILANGKPVRPRDSVSQRLLQALYAEVTSTLTEGIAVSRINDFCAEILLTSAAEHDLLGALRPQQRDHELVLKTVDQMRELIQVNTVVDRTHLESLLVNPETNVIKNGSDGDSVFPIRAELVEEGFFVRNVKDEETGVVTTVVEFD